MLSDESSNYFNALQHEDIWWCILNGGRMITSYFEHGSHLSLSRSESLLSTLHFILQPLTAYLTASEYPETLILALECFATSSSDL